MNSVEWYKGKNVTVMGLGLHGGGVGITKWLMRHGAVVTVTDLRDQHVLKDSISDIERTFLFEVPKIGKRNMTRVKYVLGKHRKSDFTKADMVVKNPAIPRGNIYIVAAEKVKVPIETDMTIFFSLCPFPITAVTGTKGKSTVTSLLYEIAKLHDKKSMLGGNIRVSPLDNLDKLISRSQKKNAIPSPVILELSSWQLEDLGKKKMSPHIGAVTNIMRDHLNRYNGIADYARAKAHNVAHQGPEDIAVLNADDMRVVKMATLGAKGRKVLWFSMKPLTGTKEGWYAYKGDVYMRTDKKNKKMFSEVSVAMFGWHNVRNTMIACAAAQAQGIPLKIITQGVRAFKGVSGRLEVVAEKKGVTYINDTTATMPDASEAALQGVEARYKGRIFLITGGADKDLDFKQWAKQVKKSAKVLYMFDGSATAKIERALNKEKVSAEIVGVRSMLEAVRFAAKNAQKGDVVLLSPGCASFGVFQNEFDRGEQFIKAVKRLK